VCCISFWKKASFETNWTKKKSKKKTYTALLLHTYEPATTLKKNTPACTKLTTDWTRKENEDIEQKSEIRNCQSVKLPLLCTVPRTLNIGNCWLLCLALCFTAVEPKYCYLVIYNYYIHSVVLFTTKKEKHLLIWQKAYCSICTYVVHKATEPFTIYLLDLIIKSLWFSRYFKTPHPTSCFFQNIKVYMSFDTPQTLLWKGLMANLFLAFLSRSMTVVELFLKKHCILIFHL
jgi:hypothetical protein